MRNTISGHGGGGLGLELGILEAFSNLHDSMNQWLPQHMT